MGSHLAQVADVATSSIAVADYSGTLNTSDRLYPGVLRTLCRVMYSLL